MDVQWRPSQKAHCNRLSILDLGLELREQIYEEVLLMEGLILVPWSIPIFSIEGEPDQSSQLRGRSLSFVSCSPSGKKHWSDVDVSLFGVSRQVRAECSKVFYGANIFLSILKKRNCLRQRMERSIEALSAYRISLVRRLEFQIRYQHTGIPFNDTNKCSLYWFFERNGHRMITDAFPALLSVTFSQKFDHPHSYSLLEIMILGENREIPAEESLSGAITWLKSNFRLRDAKLPWWVYFKLFPHVWADSELVKVIEKAWETLKR